jgi:hypothetical protein
MNARLISRPVIYPFGFDRWPPYHRIVSHVSHLRRWPTLRKKISLGIVVLALTIGAGTPALANPGQVPAPPPATDDFSPGRACAHANLNANRNFASNHATGVVGNGTPPTCAGGGGGGGG